MSDIEKLIHKFLKEQIAPVIESSVNKAIKQAMAEQNHSASSYPPGAVHIFLQ